MYSDDHPTGAPDQVTDEIVIALDAADLLDPTRPIYGAVDPDAIDRLHRHAIRHDSQIDVGFEYAGRPVTVRVGRVLEVLVGDATGEDVSRHRQSAVD